MISSKIIADSINESGDRITSMIWTFPRVILAEVNTHRDLSRNSASSRAIPFERMLKRLEIEPFIPIKWMKEHKGMQGSEYFNKRESGVAEEVWESAKRNAIRSAKQLSALGVTKQIVNRLLEPFMYHTVIVTATDWENFFALRVHKDAEIHFQCLSNLTLEAMNANKPRLLKAGEWHIPFGDSFDYDRVLDINLINETLEYTRIKIATARCARVSYLNYEGKDDYEADIKLFNQLRESGHMSPFEHCAEANPGKGRFGNFAGWKQLRQFIPGENKTDSRLLKTAKTKSNQG